MKNLFENLLQIQVEIFFTGGRRALLPLGSTCPPAVLSPTLKTGKFPQGAAGLHIWVVAPSPSPKAMAHHRPPSQSRWPPSFFCSQPPPPFPPSNTLRPLNTLVRPHHCSISKGDRWRGKQRKSNYAARKLLYPLFLTIHSISRRPKFFTEECLT